MRLYLCSFLTVCAVAPCPVLSQETEPRYRLEAVKRVEYDNDTFFNSDNKFTSGFSFQYHSNIGGDWSEIDMPHWTKFGRSLPGLDAAGLHRRVSFAIGQNIQTPDDLAATEFLPNDVPYAGSLGLELSWTAFDDQTFRGYGLIAGVVGPLSGAEGVQKFIHDQIGSVEPMGWDHQLPNELAINFNGMFKKKLWRLGNSHAWSADISADVDFGAGTAVAFAEAGLEARWGFKMPGGFVFLPDPVGRSLAYDAALIPESDRGISLYFSIVVRAAYMPHFVFLDGSLWRDTHNVNKSDSLTQIIGGIHLAGRRWALHFSSWKSSDVVSSEAAPDPSNDFGTIAIEWRF